jgi:hypothetical protein
MLGNLHLEPTYKVGDLVTSASVFIALIGFLYTWSKDRKLRTKEYADRVRTAAATTLAKIDRCESLFLSYFNFIQPVITEADDLIARTHNAVECRDFFWKQAINTRLDILRQYDAEQIELSYAPLLPFRSDIYQVFRYAIDNAKQAEDRLFWETLSFFQTTILRLVDDPDIYSAKLGNALRGVLAVQEKAYKRDLGEKFAEVRRFLQGIIGSSDKNLVATIVGERNLGTLSGASEPRLN